MTHDWLSILTIKSKRPAALGLFFFGKMADKKLSASRKSKYRAVHRERHRHAVFITEYTRIKHKAIYEEANKLYEQLSKQYPTKTKLVTCPEFKILEKSLQEDHTPTAPADISSEQTQKDHTPTAPADISSMRLNIPLMNASDVQETQDTLVFGDIYPSLMTEISPELLEQVMNEIHESDDVNIQLMDSSQIQDTSMTKEINITGDEIINELEVGDSDFFNHYDDDINDILNTEINNSLKELSPLEQELLSH